MAVLRGEASETAELPDGFEFRWMSDFPAWEAALVSISEQEQANLMRNACSEVS
jgi:hypothetical protein